MSSRKEEPTDLYSTIVAWRTPLLARDPPPSSRQRSEVVETWVKMYVNSITQNDISSNKWGKSKASDDVWDAAKRALPPLEFKNFETRLGVLAEEAWGNYNRRQMALAVRDGKVPQSARMSARAAVSSTPARYTPSPSQSELSNLQKKNWVAANHALKQYLQKPIPQQVPRLVGGKNKAKYEKYKNKNVLGKNRVIFRKKNSKSKKEYIKNKGRYISLKKYIKLKKS